jgi:hypothetical protein
MKETRPWLEEDKLDRLTTEGAMPKLIVEIGVKKQPTLLPKPQHNGEVVLCNSISLRLLPNDSFGSKRQWLNKTT